jgi:hypothetical protein
MPPFASSFFVVAWGAECLQVAIIQFSAAIGNGDQMVNHSAGCQLAYLAANPAERFRLEVCGPCCLPRFALIEPVALFVVFSDCCLMRFVLSTLMTRATTAAIPNQHATTWLTAG